jgi:hypothetical protein
MRVRRKCMRWMLVRGAVGNKAAYQYGRGRLGIGYATVEAEGLVDERQRSSKCLLVQMVSLVLD